MDYLLTPPQETDLQLDEPAVRSAAERQWPGVAITGPDDPDSIYLLVWQHTAGGDWVEVGLLASRQGFSFSGTADLVAQAVAWARSQVPDGYELVFYDQGYNFDYLVPPKMSPAELVEIL